MPEWKEASRAGLTGATGVLTLQGHTTVPPAAWHMVVGRDGRTVRAMRPTWTLKGWKAGRRNNCHSLPEDTVSRSYIESVSPASVDLMIPHPGSLSQPSADSEASLGILLLYSETQMDSDHSKQSSGVGSAGKLNIVLNCFGQRPSGL